MIVTWLTTMPSVNYRTHLLRNVLLTNHMVSAEVQGAFPHIMTDDRGAPHSLYQ